MKTRVKTRISINAKKAAVFEYLANPKYHYLWNPQLTKIYYYDRLELGTKYKAKSSLYGIEITSSNEITCFKPNEEIEFLNQTGPVQYRILLKLKQKGQKTSVSCSGEVATTHKVFSFAAPALKKIALRELQTDMKSLKLAVEESLNL